MSTIKDQAIVLRHWDYSETSQTVSLLARDLGLLRGLAKGSRRPASAFSGGFETLTLGEIVAISKPGAELLTLTAWDLQEIFWGPRRSLRAHHAGLYMVDLVRHAIVDHDPHPNLFDALAQYLRDLGSIDHVDESLLRFQWTLLREMGLSPKLSLPAEQSKATAWLFSPREGGVIGPAPKGGSPARGSWRVRRETLDLLAGLGRAGDGSEAPPATNERVIARASRLLAEHLRVVLDADLSTRRTLFGPPVHDRG